MLQAVRLSSTTLFKRILKQLWEEKRLCGLYFEPLKYLNSLYLKDLLHHYVMFML